MESRNVITAIFLNHLVWNLQEFNILSWGVGLPLEVRQRSLLVFEFLVPSRS